MRFSSNVQNAINNVQSSETDIAIKNRSIFYLRSIQSEDASLALQECITGNSVLIDHEVAYTLGQLANDNSKEFLMKLAANSSADPIVRHEAIEALGNYADQELIIFISKLLNSEYDIIKHSAQLAIDKLSLLKTSRYLFQFSKYGTRDPAFPAEWCLETCKNLYLNGTLTQKYEAMFKLRDINTAESIRILGLNFRNNQPVLLKHEIAYILGQMENPLAIPYLEKALEDFNEADVVRHEAAEALGAIGTSEAMNILRRNSNCPIQIISESISVALKIAELDTDEYLDIDNDNKF